VVLKLDCRGTGKHIDGFWSVPLLSDPLHWALDFLFTWGSFGLSAHLHSYIFGCSLGALSKAVRVSESLRPS
jgi:hypothetical protein